MADPTGLSPEQVRALATLTAVRELSRFYLAGGTAVALRLSHRRSVDVDLFSDQAAEVALAANRRGNSPPY